MVHPQIKSGWHVIRGNWKVGDDESTDFFIGRFQNDRQYHLLGHRPRCVAYMFSENECSSLDLGIVELPSGKHSLGELVRDDELKVVPQGDGEKPYTFYYQRSA
jgi:hypothetical protein